MAATVKVYAATQGTNGAPVYNTVDTTDAGPPSVSFSRGAAYNDTASPVTIPTAGNRRFTYYRHLCLYVTATAATTLSNMKVAIASTPAMVLGLEFHIYSTPGAKAAYLAAAPTQLASSNPFTGPTYPADDAITTGAPPTNYTRMATSTQSDYVDPTYFTFDATGGSAGTAGQVGKFATIVTAVTGSYTGGGNASTTLPNIKFQYDEA